MESRAIHEMVDRIVASMKLFEGNRDSDLLLRKMANDTIRLYIIDNPGIEEMKKKMKEIKDYEKHIRHDQERKEILKVFEEEMYRHIHNVGSRSSHFNNY